PGGTTNRHCIARQVKLAHSQSTKCGGIMVPFIAREHEFDPFHDPPVLAQSGSPYWY
ncbi:hypothetical protein FRC12_005741, partial [Ceratobasidium sp. 428]